jgi:hypothetical protein
MDVLTIGESTSGTAADRVPMPAAPVFHPAGIGRQSAVLERYGETPKRFMNDMCGAR